MRGSASDSRLYHALSLATDLVVINLVLVLVSLPVVSIGAALTACLVVCMQLVAGTLARPLTEFFTAFGRAFWPATIVWLGSLGLGVLLVWEWAVAGQLVSPTLRLGVRGVILFAALVLVLVSIWFWPMLARRTMAGQQPRAGELVALLRDALLASVQQLPRSLAALAVVAAPVVVGMVSVEVGARLILWFVLIGFALAAYLVVLVLREPLGVVLDDTEE